MMVSSSHLLLKICKGDSTRAQRILSLVSTLASIQSLFVTSASGYALDHYGRKPVLVAACFLSAFARSLPVFSPSIAAYVSYRLLNAAAFVPVRERERERERRTRGGQRGRHFSFSAPPFTHCPTASHCSSRKPCSLCWRTFLEAVARQSLTT